MQVLEMLASSVPYAEACANAEAKLDHITGDKTLLHPSHKPDVSPNPSGQFERSSLRFADYDESKICKHLENFVQCGWCCKIFYFRKNNVLKGQLVNQFE